MVILILVPLSSADPENRVGPKQISQKEKRSLSSSVLAVPGCCSCPWRFAFSRAGSCPWGRLDFPLSPCRAAGTIPAFRFFLSFPFFSGEPKCRAQLKFDFINLHLLFDKNNEGKCFESEV